MECDLFDGTQYGGLSSAETIGSCFSDLKHGINIRVPVSLPSNRGRFPRFLRILEIIVPSSQGEMESPSKLAPHHANPVLGGGIVVRVKADSVLASSIK
jgi:hypothetical protein